jgi:hypothetical protein
MEKNGSVNFNPVAQLLTGRLADTAIQLFFVANLADHPKSQAHRAESQFSSRSPSSMSLTT